MPLYLEIEIVGKFVITTENTKGEQNEYTCKEIDRNDGGNYQSSLRGG